MNTNIMKTHRSHQATFMLWRDCKIFLVSDLLIQLHMMFVSRSYGQLLVYPISDLREYFFY